MSIDRRRNVTWVAGALLVALLPLAATLGVAYAISPGRLTHGSSAPRTTLPLQLQALEQKMQKLHVNSERYTQITRGTVTIANEVNGHSVGHRRMVSLDDDIRREVSIAPPCAEEIDAKTGKPVQIQIGSTEYTYSQRIVHKGRRYVWVRSHGTRVGTTFPYRADPAEVNVGGKGSYAQLFNLLTTVVGFVAVLRPVSVDGQSTSEFTATIEPFRLLRGLTVEDLRNLKKHPVLTTLRLFMNRAGYPLRVILSENGQYIHSIVSTDITAIEIPVKVSPPPARETISRARAR